MTKEAHEAELKQQDSPKTVPGHFMRYKIRNGNVQSHLVGSRNNLLPRNLLTKIRQAFNTMTVI